MDAKTAVRKAIDYLIEITSATVERVRDVCVEEVVVSDDGVFRITLSYVRDTQQNTRYEALGETPHREYKEFEVHRTDQEVHAMKIRALAS